MKTRRKPTLRNTQTKKRPSKALWFLVIVVASSLLAIYAYEKAQGKRLQRSSVSTVATTLRKQLDNICKGYMQVSSRKDIWWLEEAQQPNDSLLVSLDAALRKTEQALIAASGASPLATQISCTFTSLFVTEYINGNSMAVGTNGTGRAKTPGALEVCFFAEKDFRKGQMPTTLFYSKNWKAVCIAAVQWPDIFFVAGLMHELGHAYKERTGDKYPMFSDGWAKEEVTMHQLEAAVLDYRTTNFFSQALQKICSAHPAPDVQHFMTLITPEELISLDSMISIEHSGEDVRGTALMQYLVSLGLVYIDQNKGSMEDKIKHYRWVIGK